MAERVWRAITASGIVASTMVGRIRWLTAEAEGALLAGQQAVDQHEAGYRLEEVDQRYPARDRRPVARMPEKKMISSRPHQKIGIE
jgi:hypothetical protein